MLDLTNKNIITYEEIRRKDPERTIDELNKIISETNTDVIHRAVTRGRYFSDTEFDRIKTIVDGLKANKPSIKLIGTVYAHNVFWDEIDDITKTVYGYSHPNLIADTTGGSSTILKDSNAMFQTWNVELESPIKNVTEKTVAFVQSIDSETQITTKQPQPPNSLLTPITNWNGDTYHIGNQVWKDMAFDPRDYGSAITKYEYQTSNPVYPLQERCRGDIQKTAFKDLLIHRSQRLIDLGMDGIWFDILYGNANWLYTQNKPGWSTQNTAITNFLNELKNLYPIYPIHPTRLEPIYMATWIPQAYLDSSPKYPFDYFTESPNNTEIINNTPDNARWQDKINRYPNTPLVVFIDWSSSGKYQLWYLENYDSNLDYNSNEIKNLKNYLWYLSQNTTAYPTYQENHDYQVSVIKKFTDFFKSKGIKFAYPVHGGAMCNNSVSSPCNIYSWGIYNTYDAMAPEFQTYDTIKELMCPTCISTKQPSEAGISPILILGLLSGALYLYLKNRSKKEAKNI